MRNVRAKKRNRSWAVAITACVCSTATLAAANGVSELDDVVARMQFAYYTNDARALSGALDELAKSDLPASMKGMKEYFTAYGQWRLADLRSNHVPPQGRSSRASVADAADACRDAARAATTLDARMAEAFALEAICASMSRLDVTNAGCADHKGMRTARELAPSNPRVLLIGAQCAAQADKDQPTLAIERLKQVVSAFERAPASQPGRPDWGHAEALVLLGQSYLAQRDTVAARDVIERALVIAPDFEKAKAALTAAAR